MPVPRTCTGCGATLGPRNTSGNCRTCFNKALAAAPGIKDRQRAGIRRKIDTDPAYRAAKATRNLSPESAARRREHGRQMADTLRACNDGMTAEKRAANGKKRSATMLAWCPPEWRDHYRGLIKRGRRKPVAQAMTFAAIAEAERRAEIDRAEAARLAEKERAAALAAMTPFERQLARVAAGVALIPKPRLRRADPDFTLGGVSAGLL